MTVGVRSQSLIALADALGLRGAPVPEPQPAERRAARLRVPLRDGLIERTALRAPAGPLVLLSILNQEPFAVRLRSRTLGLDEVVPGGGEAALPIRPAPAGRHSFAISPAEHGPTGAVIGVLVLEEEPDAG